jgi:hypothetical protein
VNKIIKSFGVIACCFYFTNLFTMQTQTELAKTAQQPIMETKLEQVLNLLKEVKDIENQPNSLASKATGAVGTVLSETLLIGISGVSGILATILFSNNGIIDKISGARFNGGNFSNGDGPVILAAFAGSFIVVGLGTYGLLKFLLLIKNKLNGKDPLDKETKDRLTKIERIVEQIQLMQDLKKPELNQEIQNSVAG